ncbi:choice-of-anchor M domain-containing protein [Corynebacterium uberis]|uniref:choice-of-anchor M domain-containing protein n=1 Tax=Corynebacterium TaxID=1716 RepID=UPI001D0BDFBC|nr:MULTISPECIES: choice-of-anchor M domain-containing protein [Corynebacterium]MCZ9309539.1 choice-of-anchor M domain-containing protein [Corynebacterium sp. c6VSa_13]UDL73085.1 choice-of-anchor M domain-containing protein [Corynebacterium uberis]UDL76038.1 choice-of-anchor M domain-containing protein [Corynebacterium uberis]UDL78250.1 choice-of-anchor M domain-containing protein [Corynebacterium uberis]UDL80533.1 choice-of-anchor M domain-containing protein [Corynebacterium uberis]
MNHQLPRAAGWLRPLAALSLAVGLTLGTAGLGEVSLAAANPLDQHVSADESIVPPGTQATLEEGHADMGPAFVNGTFDLLVRDDSVSPPVHRHAEDLVFKVGEGAQMPLPEASEGGKDYQFTGAKPGAQVWVIPQTQVTGVPWLGWNTQAPSLGEQVDTGVDLEFMGHQGPGHFSVFLQAGGFAAPQKVWTSTEDAPQKAWVEMNSHAHANWVFTQPGIHLVAVRATATLRDGTTASTTRVLRFAVGQDADVAQARTASWDGDPTVGKAADAGSNPHRGWLIGGAVLAAALCAGAAAFYFGRRASRSNQ